MSFAPQDTPTGPLIKLNLPSPEEYRKRKVALISGAHISYRVTAQCSHLVPYIGITGQDGSYLYVQSFLFPKDSGSISISEPNSYLRKDMKCMASSVALLVSTLGVFTISMKTSTNVRVSLLYF
jgi:hypothetical protein